jgi:hypothetical protein
MKKLLLKSVSILALLTHGMAFGSQNRVEYTREVAIGLGGGFNQKDYGTQQSYRQYSGEVFGYYYYPLFRDFLLRPGLRLGYTGGDASKLAPASLNVNEKDFRGVGELSILWTQPYFVIPALTVGGGMTYRKTTLETQSPVINSSSNGIDGASYLGFFQGQFSTIFPLMRGKIEIAPYVRYTHLFQDTRIGFSGGAEASFALF